MPGLRAFGRRWRVGSDDLSLPAVIEIMVRGAWSTGIAIVMGLYREDIFPPGCTNNSLMFIYFVGLLSITAAHMILNAITTIISTRGTIFWVFPRRGVSVCVYVKILLWVVEAGWVGIGTYLALTASCTAVVKWTVVIVALSGWVLLIWIVGLLILIFDPTHLNDEKHLEKLWENRCHRWYTYITCNTRSKDMISDIARLLAQFFGGLDLVLSDYAAGMILLASQNADKAQVNEVESSLLHKETPNPHVPPNAPAIHPAAQAIQEAFHGPNKKQKKLPGLLAYPKATWMTLSNAEHYMKFALGCYGWPFYMYAHLFTGACQLAGSCRCCRGCSNSDNCCECNHAAIRKITGIPRDDIIYASFHNKIEEPAFYICYDHTNKKVIVAIRGTMSLRDCFTDLNAVDEDLHVPDVGAQQVHSGILASSTYVLRASEETLYEAFIEHADYGLVITGHSLGAGTAALMAVQLRDKHPDLECYAFSPPGGLISDGLQQYSQDFVLSVVVGDDLVPRLGLITLEKLKVRILLALRNCNKAKHDIISRGLWKLICGGKSKSVNQVSQEFGIRISPEIQEMIDTAVRDCDEFMKEQSHLYMPGVVIFLQKKTSTKKREKEQYRLEWKHAKTFDEIVVSPSMLTDHLPDGVMETLTAANKQSVRV